MHTCIIRTPPRQLRGENRRKTLVLLYNAHLFYAARYKVVY